MSLRLTSMRFATLFLGLSNIAGVFSPTLLTALTSNPQLSAFLGLIGTAQLPSNLTNATILAPSNQAFAALSNVTIQALASSPRLLNQVVSYHLLQGNFPSFGNATFIPTLLQQNVTGGQRVHAVPSGNSTTFYTGLLANATTVNSTIPFDGGSIHVINSLLIPPVNVSSTSVALNLTSAVGALMSAGLSRAADITLDLTIFVPNNTAFRQIASVLQDVTTSQLASILEYHVIPSAIYSNAVNNNTSIQTGQNSSVTLTIKNGIIYVNNARVILANVLTSNGVMHVIDQVLNPASSAGFAGASSGTSDVFTSGIPTPTSTINTAAVTSRTNAAGTSSTNSSSSNTDGGSGDLSTGAKAAIGVVVPIAAIGAIVAAILLTRRHMLKKNKATSAGTESSVPNTSEKAELAGTMGYTTTGGSGAAYAKPELSNSKSVRKSEADGGPVPVRHEVEGEGVSASIRNVADLNSYERYELEGEGHEQHPHRNA